MKTYKVIGWQRYTAYDKVYFDVAAESMDEALSKVKDAPEQFEIDTKCLDCVDFEYIDLEDWEVYE